MDLETYIRQLKSPNKSEKDTKSNDQSLHIENYDVDPYSIVNSKDFQFLDRIESHKGIKVLSKDISQTFDSVTARHFNANLQPKFADHDQSKTIDSRKSPDLREKIVGFDAKDQKLTTKIISKVQSSSDLH